MRKETGDIRGQAQVLNNLGKNQVYFGHFSTARDHFAQALALSQEIGSSAWIGHLFPESLALLYDTLRNYKSALETYREFKALNDSLYSTESRMTIARLEDAFRRDKEKKVFELEAKRKDAENERRRVWNIALAGALFFLLLTAFLLFNVMRARVPERPVGETGEVAIGKREAGSGAAHAERSSEYKDRELTANALFLLNKNELIAHIAERLLKAKSAFKEENQRVVQSCATYRPARQTPTGRIRNALHPGAYHLLPRSARALAALTPNERKLCAFLRLNMSTKDISAITHQTVNSITVARSTSRSWGSRARMCS